MSPRRAVSMQNLPTAGRWAVYFTLALVFAIACAFLSHWQFSRNEERSAQLQLVADNYDQSPVALDALIPAGGELAASDEWRPVELVGEYLSDELLLARNRPHGGTSAFEVLVPFRLDDGRVVIVDRGWVPPGADQPDPDVIPAAPEGEATVVVRMRVGEQLPSSGRSAPEGQVPTINLPLIADTIPSGADVETSAYGVMVSEDPAPATRPTALEPPSEDPGPHLSYAIQWILFAVMGFVFIGYVIRTERRHRREDAEDDAAAASEQTNALAAASGTASAPSTPRPPRARRDRDADDEDALIDASRR